MIDLAGIDSAGEQRAEDVMELVGAEGASHKTQELLLDHVMNGFVYSLFELKWARFASRFHHALLFLDCCYVLLLGLLCFALKQVRARSCAAT